VAPISFYFAPWSQRQAQAEKISRLLGIEGVGFYLARQGVFVQWPLGALVQPLTAPREIAFAELQTDFYQLILTKLDYR
jgi:hypothetical protein